MVKTIARLCGLVCLLGLAACSVEENAELSREAVVEDAALSDAADPITIGHIDSLDSEILGETRDLWIYLPESSKRPENSHLSYPVVYLLDGNGHFHSVSGMIRQLSSVNGNSELPEMIVVGIPNTDRMRDLTPSHTEGSSGGGKAFLSFIQTELIPYIEETYPVTTYRSFIGHSLGGLTVIDALFDMPEMFQNYVAIDPSLWWDDQLVLKKSEAMLNELDLTGKSLFVAVANTMRGRVSYDEVRQDSDPSTTHIRSILEFARLAEADTGNGLSFAWEYYDDDSHGSVPLIAEYDALRFLFDWHSRVDLTTAVSLDAELTAEQVLTLIGNHFDTVSSRFGYRVLPPESFIASGARGMLADERLEVALAMLNLNLQNYPQSANAHEALGDYYVEHGSSDDALRHLTHAVELGAGAETQEKITALLADD